MNAKRYNLALKTACFLLFIGALLLGTACVAGACYLASEGAYTMKKADLLEQGLRDRLTSMADDIANAYAQETYGTAEEEMPYEFYYYYYASGGSQLPGRRAYSETTNYCYEIRDASGQLLKTNYSGQSYLARQDTTVQGEYYRSNGVTVVLHSVDEPYTVTGYVLQDLKYDDIFSQYVQMVDGIYNYRVWLIVIGIACLVAMICLLVYLLSAAGHRPDREGIVLNPLDRIPGDLYVTAVVLAVCGLAELFHYAFQWDAWITLTVGACSLALAGTLVLGCILTLTARGKYGKGYWWRRSVTGFCLLLILRVCRWILRGLRSVFRTVPTVWKWLLIGGAVGVFSLFCLNPRTTGLGMLLTVAMWTGMILYPAWSFGKLRRAAGQMAQGHLQEKLDTKHLHGSFRQMGEDLNSLGQGASLAVERQMKSERMKTELITNVSHDIKTPLTSIVNYVDLLQKPHSPEEEAQYLDVLARQSQRLKKLTEDLVEMSKASSGSIPVSLAPTNVVELVNQALAEYEAKMERAGLNVVLSTTQEEVLVLADGRLFWRVLDNLLGNCVKYAQTGTRVYVDVVKYEKKVMISVKNVSRDELNLPAEELMERFVRGDRARNTEGSGLGLNIAKTLMELQKGKLNLVIDGDLFKAVLLLDNLREEPET